MTAVQANPYTPGYYDAIVSGSDRSASVVVPLVMGMVGAKSVVDVGCGTGAWLAEFIRAGATRVLGLDGEYVRRDQLLIPPDRFRAVNLCKSVRIEERFDLVVCLEVAEHLPPNCAAGLIETLTSLGLVVLFSAAIPYQGGEGHVNERWPTYWQELFAARGYKVIDAVRKRVWSDRRVEPWYQQNVLLYAADRAIAANAALQAEFEATFPDHLSMIHPRLYGPLLERAGIKPPGPWVPAGASDSVEKRA